MRKRARCALGAEHFVNNIRKWMSFECVKCECLQRTNIADLHMFDLIFAFFAISHVCVCVCIEETKAKAKEETQKQLNRNGITIGLTCLLTYENFCCMYQIAKACNSNFCRLFLVNLTMKCYGEKTVWVCLHTHTQTHMHKKQIGKWEKSVMHENACLFCFL